MFYEYSVFTQEQLIRLLNNRDRLIDLLRRRMDKLESGIIVDDESIKLRKVNDKKQTKNEECEPSFQDLPEKMPVVDDEPTEETPFENSEEHQPELFALSQNMQGQESFVEPSTPVSDTPIEKMSYKEMKEYARSHSIKGFSKYTNKTTLLDYIVKMTSGDDEPVVEPSGRDFTPNMTRGELKARLANMLNISIE